MIVFAHIGAVMVALFGALAAGFIYDCMRPDAESGEIILSMTAGFIVSGVLIYGMLYG